MESLSQQKAEKPVFRGELALIIIVVLNSFAVDLMLYSGFGISAISSVPFAFSEVCPIFSLGTWTYLFQSALVLALMVLRRKFVPGYLLAFIVGVAFGKMMDVHMLWMGTLPLTLPLRCLYFLISVLALSLGIALSNHCKLPIIPTDLFPRELSVLLNKPYQWVKTGFDLLCLATTAALMLICLHGIYGIGVGTVFCAFVMGKAAAWLGGGLTKKFHFVSFLAPV